jgi:hypothetical protein
MRRMSMKSLTLGLIAGTALSLAAAAAEAPSGTSGNGATFVNGSSHAITLYARFGSNDGSCEGQPKDQTVTLDPKQSLSVDSGGSPVCFCLQVPDRNTCPSGWATVKPGGTRHLM